MIRATIAALGLVAVTGLSGAAAPATTVSWSERGLVGVTVVVPVDAAKARAAVPARYTPVLRNGFGQVVLVSRLVELSIGGGPARTAVVHDGGVVVSPEPGSTDLTAYLLWQATDDAPLAKALAALDLPASTPPDTTAEQSPAGTYGTVFAGNTGAPVHYALQAVGLEPSAARATTIRLLRDGRRGTVRVTYTCAACRASATAASVVEPDVSGQLRPFIVTPLVTTGDTVLLHGDLNAVATLK